MKIALLLLLLTLCACGTIDLDRPVQIDVEELQPDEPEAYRWASKTAIVSLGEAVADLGGEVGYEKCLPTPTSHCNPIIVVRLATPDECDGKAGFVHWSDLNTIAICRPALTSLWTLNKVLRHELGHVLGGGHMSDEKSVMTPGAESSRPDRSDGAIEMPYSALDIAEICSHPWRSIGGVCGR